MRDSAEARHSCRVGEWDVNAWVAGRLFHSHLIRVLPQECGRLRAVTTREGGGLRAWCMGFGARRAPLQAGHGQRHFHSQGTQSTRNKEQSTCRRHTKHKEQGTQSTCRRHTKHAAQPHKARAAAAQSTCRRHYRLAFSNTLHMRSTTLAAA